MNIFKSNRDSPSIAVSYKAPQHNYALPIIGFFIASILIGFLSAPFINFQRFSQERQHYSLPQTGVKSSIGLDILQNPMFTYWSAYVKGKIISKDLDSYNKSFTITPVKEIFGKDGSITYEDISDGQPLKIIFVPKATSFKVVTGTEETKEANTIAFEELPTNAIVLGQASIFPRDKSFDVVGKTFSVRKL